MTFLRKALALSTLTLLAALSIPGAASASTGGGTDLAARSVKTSFFNDSECTYKFSFARVWGGTWSILPPSTIAPHQTVAWQTDSNGFMTGTEAEIHYVPAAGCASQPPSWTVYWNNPYVGSNSYSWEFNDPNPAHWQLTMVGGSGNNAVCAYHLFH